MPSIRKPTSPTSSPRSSTTIPTAASTNSCLGPIPPSAGSRTWPENSAYAETAEDDGYLVPFGYLELIVEDVGALARGSIDRPSREVDDKVHGERIRLGGVRTP